MLLSYRCSAAISKLPVKLLVLAQIPPPHHGQSIMVQTLVDGLPQIAPDIEIFHVNLSLSSTTTDIGRWQPMKLIAAWRAARTAIKLARHHQVDALYYVPAPGKRIALWRDIFILRLVRPIVPRLVLHWHASGLGEWLQTSASPLERRLAHAVLDHADLALTLAPSLAADAALFQPHHTTIVPNGIADPFADRPVQRPPPPPSGSKCSFSDWAPPPRDFFSPSKPSLPDPPHCTSRSLATSPRPPTPPVSSNSPRPSATVCGTLGS